MKKILVAVDGSAEAQRALAVAIQATTERKVAPEIHLATVHPPVPYAGRVTQALGKEALESYYNEEEAEMMKPAREALDRAGVKYTTHTAVGDPAEQLVRIAVAQQCDAIFMGTHGRGRIGSLVLGSVAQKVLSLAQVPVTLVP